MLSIHPWCNCVNRGQHFGGVHFWLHELSDFTVKSERKYSLSPPLHSTITITKGYCDFSFQFENITVKISAVQHQVSLRAGGRIPLQVISDLIQQKEAHLLKTPQTANAQSSFEEKPSHILSRAAGWYFLPIFSSQPSQVCITATSALVAYCNAHKCISAKHRFSEEQNLSLPAALES